MAAPRAARQLIRYSSGTKIVTHQPSWGHHPGVFITSCTIRLQGQMTAYPSMIQPPQPTRDGLTIQRASPRHIPFIKSMVDSAYSKYIERIGRPPAPMLADYDYMLEAHDIFVLEDEANEIVGAIVLAVDQYTRSVEINNLVVSLAAQGRGYGRVLLDCAEDIALSESCSALILYTNVKMYENLGMYVKMGFVETGRKIEDGFERVYFRKDLI